MKKKVALTAAAVALVGTLAVGGTLAWFTDTEEATNVVTMGEVDIVLNEDGKSDGDIINGGLKYDDIKPGDTFAKEVTVNNIDEAAFVRAFITVNYPDVWTANDAPIEFYKDGEPLDVTWTGNKVELTAWAMQEDDKDGAHLLFDAIKVPETWGNKFVESEFSIKVDVEAVQSANLTIDTAFDAFDNAEGGKVAVPDLKSDKPSNDSHGKYTVASGSSADME